MVDECFKDPESRKYVVRKSGSLMQAEMKTMCSEKVDSILCRKTVDALAGFQWIQLFLSVLHACTKTRRPRQNRDAVIGVCTALILITRRRTMNLVQRIDSLILQAGHCAKQVYVLLFCMLQYGQPVYKWLFATY